MLCTRLENLIHVCLQGVDHPSFLFELRTFIVEPLLLVEKPLLFRLQRLQARQFFISLHGKQCTPRRLKNHKLGFVLCFVIAELWSRLIGEVILMPHETECNYSVLSAWDSKPHRHAALFLSSPFPLLPRSGKDEQ